MKMGSTLDDFVRQDGDGFAEDKMKMSVGGGGGTEVLKWAL